jgi:outer membrane protein OmpA-like peptidoglycan-associated protein
MASPALARDDAWYVELDGGVMLLEDIDFDVAGLGNAVTLDSDYGYDFGGIIGYDFGTFRLEVEASYREADPDELDVNAGTIPVVGINPGLFGGAGTYDVAGDTNALSFMVNGLVDFGPDDGLQGFIGAGAGIARVDFDSSVNSTGPGFLNDSDTGFAWQILAGIRAPLTDRIDVGVKYRFFNADGVDFRDTAGRSVEARFRSHSLLGTFAYNFGGEEPMPEPVEAPLPPAPPPPPPVPVVQPVCNKGPYIVFFDWDRADITPEAATILDNAVAAYGNCDRVPIMLAGHTDRSGSARYNMGLAERRNSSVRGYLASRGVADTAITAQAFGESQPRVPTADGVRELQNRRVEITYGPGSGF